MEKCLKQEKVKTICEHQPSDGVDPSSLDSSWQKCHELSEEWRVLVKDLKNMHRSSSHDVTRFSQFQCLIYFSFLSAEFTTWMLRHFFFLKTNNVIKNATFERNYFSKCTFDCKDN